MLVLHGRIKLGALVTKPNSVARYLTKLGEPLDVPGRTPSRGPPYWKSTVLRQKGLPPSRYCVTQVQRRQHSPRTCAPCTPNPSEPPQSHLDNLASLRRTAPPTSMWRLPLQSPFDVSRGRTGLLLLTRLSCGGRETYSAWYARLMYTKPDSEMDPTIADVHTHPGGLTNIVAIPYVVALARFIAITRHTIADGLFSGIRNQESAPQLDQTRCAVTPSVGAANVR